MNIGLIVAILAIVLVFQGTRTTGPNPSFMEQVPTTEEIVNMPGSNRKRCYEFFTELHQKNPGLAEELGRIPEFADNEISDKDLEALVNMSDYFSTIKSKYPDRFDQAFEEILDMGIKDKRKYCSPLRFLFWLAEEKKFDEESISYTSNPLKYFSLKTLLRLGVTRFPDKGVNKLGEVTELLNTPELVSIWLSKNLRYLEDPPRGYAQPPKVTVRRGGGDCEDWAILVDYFLSKAGYDSYIISVMWSKGGHGVAAYKLDGDIFLLGDTMSGKKQEIIGPFGSNQEIAGYISGSMRAYRWTVTHWHNFKYR